MCKCSPFLYVLAAAVATAIFLLAPAISQARTPPEDATPAMKDYFGGLKNDQGVGCCGQSDCHVDVQYREAGDSFDVYIPERKEWDHVPPDKVLSRSLPPGHSGAVACWYEDESIYFFCFVPPTFF